MGGGVGLSCLFQEVIPFRSGAELRGLAAGFFRKHAEAIFQGRLLFRATPFCHLRHSLFELNEHATGEL